MMFENIKNKIDNMNAKKLIFILFVISVLFRILCSGYNKVYDFYPDSLRFYDIAKNIYNNKWFVVRNIHLDYQKILYSLCITPFFNIKNAFVRVRCIDVFNAIVACSSIFPFYIIENKILKNNKYKNLVLILYSFSPIFLYTESLLSENVYITIWMWCVVFMIYYIEKKKKIYIVIASILYFLAYFCREIMIIYFVATIITLVLVNKFNMNNKNLINKKDVDKNLDIGKSAEQIDNKYDKNINNKIVINLSIFILIFVGLNIILKWTLLNNIGYTYGVSGTNQIGIEAICNVENILDFLFDNIYMICAICLVFLIFPILILINNITNMDKNEFFIFVSNVLNVLFLILVTTYTISIREDINLNFPRLHFRYMIGSIPLLYMLTFNYLEDANIKKIFEKKNMLCVIIIFVLSIVFFRGINSYTLDQPFMLWYVMFDNIIKFVTKDSFIDIIRAIIIDILLFILVVIIYNKWKKNKYNAIRNIYIWLLIIICIFNNIYGIYDLRKNQIIDKSYIEDINKISKYNFENDDNIVLLATDNARSKAAKTIDMYLDIKNNIIYQSLDVYINKFETEENIKDIIFHEPVLNKDFRIDKIDYLLIQKNQRIDMTSISNIEEAQDIVLNNFILYKNKDNSKIVYE